MNPSQDHLIKTPGRSRNCGFKKCKSFQTRTTYFFLVSLFSASIKEFLKNQSGSGKTVFYQGWFDQGVYSICDILDSSGMYLNFTDFCRKFSVKSSFLTYFQVLSAIPKRLLEKARDSFGNNSIFTPGNSTFHLSPSLLIDLSKLTTGSPSSRCEELLFF